MRALSGRQKLICRLGGDHGLGLCQRRGQAPKTDAYDDPVKGFYVHGG